VTGGIERGESVMQAAAREVREETGLTPLRWWALEHLATFYEPALDRIRVVPVFAAEVAWTDPVYLSDEHDRYAFVSPAIARRRVCGRRSDARSRVAGRSGVGLGRRGRARGDAAHGRDGAAARHARPPSERTHAGHARHTSEHRSQRPHGAGAAT
jgi:ADP-ribose pyrophosphatase YjhB (NUDIX family)